MSDNTSEWHEITPDNPAPAWRLVWMCGIQDGKDIVGPRLCYYDPEDDFYYTGNGTGHAWMTHWLLPQPPELPGKAVKAWRADG